VRAEIVSILKKTAARESSVELAQLAVHAQDDAFGKIKGLISDMIAKLQKQAAEEADHKAYCDEEKAKNEAKRDDRSAKLDKYTTRHEAATAEAAQLKQDVAKLTGQIADQDAAFDAATKTRQEENAAYNSLMADSKTQIDAVSQALQVLKDFYGASSSHEEKSDSATNVIAFLETVQADIIKIKDEAEASENSAADAYTKMKNENEVLRASRASEIKGKEQESTRLAGMIADLGSDIKGTGEELDATLAYLEKLKGSCVHEVMSFEERAAKMQAEIKGLQQALEILENETATSFLQRRQ
jgi:chromosome segregation ATPase